MKVYRFKRICGNFLAALLVFIFPISSANALIIHEKLWTGFLVQKSFSEKSPWSYRLYLQERFWNEPHPWQTNLIEGALGYSIVPFTIFNLGYRYAVDHPLDDTYSVNMFIQELVIAGEDSANRYVRSRSRLEEFRRSNQSQTALRFRQRIYLEWPQRFFGFIAPVTHEEIFLQLNKTDYTSHQLFAENRLFLGGDFYVTNHDFWEIGYMNQYQFKTPQRNQNALSHILSITYFII